MQHSFFYDPQGSGTQNNNNQQHPSNHHQPHQYNPYDPNNQILTFPHPPHQPWSANQSEINGGNYSSSNSGGTPNNNNPNSNEFSSAATTTTTSLFDGVKNFFSGLLTPQNDFTQVQKQNNRDDDDFDSDEESDEDPEQQVKQLYGVNIKKKEFVETRKSKQSTSSLNQMDEQEEDEVPISISRIVSMNGRGQTLTLNKDFDISKCSKLAVKLRYEKTAVEKEMENERAWSVMRHTRNAQEEDSANNNRMKTKHRFVDNDDYGFYDELAREDAISKEVKESTKSPVTREETIEVDVPFTMYAVAYTSFGAPICYFASDQTSGPRTFHSIASIPKHEKTVKKKGLKLEEISSFGSISFLDTRSKDEVEKPTADSSSNDGSDDEQSTTSSKKATVQEEIAMLSLKKGKHDKHTTLTDERFHYVIFFVEFTSPELFLKQQIQKRKGETKIIKRVPFSNKMTLSILDITFGEEFAKELCRFNTIVNNRKNGFGRQIVGGIHYKPKMGWKFRSSNEFQPLPPKKLIVKLESVEDIPFLSDVYISLWFNDDKCKTKVIKSKNPKFNEIFEYDITSPESNADVCYAIMFDQIKILLKEKKAFQKEEKRLIGEVILPPLPQIFSGNNYVFAYTLPPLATNTSEKDRAERKKVPILYFSSEYGLQNQGVIGTSRAKIAIFLSW